MPSPALARAAVDRASDQRADDAWVEAAWRDPRAQVLVVCDGRVPVDGSVVDGSVDDAVRPADPGADGGPGVATPRLHLVAARAAPPGDRYFLGLDDQVPVFAVAAVAELPGLAHHGLRELGALLSDRDAGLLVHAVALANWHVTHRHCSRCGTPTLAAPGGHVRRCPQDGSQHFPRVDPAVIMLVHDGGDGCLLGRHPGWPARRFSTLAGFVEPGEPLEHAVAREVREEVGVEVSDVIYQGSQPWPFPSSLMLGFTARAVTTRLTLAEPDEIAEAEWFTKDELADALRRGGLLLPGKVSIAWWLIRQWYGAELPASRTW